MVQKLSSLRISPELDVAQYVRAAGQKVDADGKMAASAKGVGQALAAVDAAAAKSIPGVSALSRAWITGYGDAAKFESAVRNVGHALDRGMDTARAATQLDGIYRKFGQTANAADLAKQGFVKLAPVIQSVNDQYEIMAATADRATQATMRLANAQAAQKRINDATGVSREPSGYSARTSAYGFQDGYGDYLDNIRSKFDPLFVAQKEYREKLGELRTALAINAIGEGVYAEAMARTKTEFVARLSDLGKVSAGQRAASAEVEAAAAREIASREAIAAAAKREAAAKDIAARANRFASAVDPQFAAQLKYNEKLAEGKALLDAGAIGAQHYAAGLAQASKELATATAENSGLMATLRDANSVFMARAAAAKQEAAAARDLAARGAAFSASVDPDLAAQQRYNATIDEARKLLDGSAIGATHYAAGLAKASKELAAARAENSGLMATLREADKVFRASAAAAEQKAIELRKLRAEVNPLAEAELANIERINRYTVALANHDITQDEFTEGKLRSEKILSDTKRSIEGANVATSKWANGMGFARHELVNLSRQGQDVFVSLASGQSLLTVAIQQGTQVFDIFAASQAKAGTAALQLGMTLLRFSPIIAGVTAAAYAMYAAFSVGSERQALSNSLLGAGRTSGLTAGGLEALAQESAKSAEITVSNARLIGAEFVKLGAIAQSSLPRLTELTKNYAAATGQALPDAAKELATALGDPARGAENLGEKIGTLDSTTVRMIRTAVDLNDKLRAQKLLMDELARASANAAEMSLTKWERLVNQMGLVAGRIKETVATPLVDKTLEEQIDAQRAIVADAQRRARQPFANLIPNKISGGQDEARARQVLAGLEAELRKKQEIAQADARFAEGNKKIADAEILSRATSNAGLAARLKLYNEEAGKVSVLEKSLRELVDRRNAIGVPDDSNRQQFSILTTQIREQTEALEGQKKKVQELSQIQAGRTVEQEKASRAIEIDIKASQAKTLEDFKAVAALRAENQALVESVGPTEMKARVKAAEREATAKGIIALNEEAKARRNEIDATNAATKAATANGKAAGDVAEMRERARQRALETGGNAESISQDELNKKIAEQKRLIAETTSQREMDRQAVIAGNRAALEGQTSSTLRAQAEERVRAAREKLVQMEALLGKGNKEAAAAAKAEADSVERTQRARNESGAVDFFNQQGQELETLRKQRDLIFETRDLRTEELEVLRAKQAVNELGLNTEIGIGKQIVDRAREIGKEKQLTEDILRLRNQIRQAQDFAADSMKSFLSDLITGTEGLNGALKNLGKGFLSASLDALISGKGPLAGITGLASATKDGQGGILGALTTGLQKLPGAVEKGAAKGSTTGVSTGLGSLAGEGGLLSGFGIDGKQLAGGLTAIAGLAGSYGIGLSAGSNAQAIGGGAISGLTAGLGAASAGLGSASILGPIGLIAGAALAYYGKQSADKARREQLKQQAEQNYKEAQPQIATLGSQLRGDPQNTLALRIAEAETATRKLTDVAFYAKRYDEEAKLYSDFITYKARTYKEFGDAYSGMLSALESGLGPDSAFGRTRDQVKTLGESLKGFIDDTKTVFGEGAAEIELSKAAARTYALQVFDGVKTLSTVSTRMEEIRGASVSLQQVLVDLGMSATEAAQAISTRATAALARLKETFESELIGKTNNALDRSYLNEAGALISELAVLRADAASLGTDQGLVTNYFKAAAQSIVDGAELTGEAFADLIRQFPQLNGFVQEFTQKLDAVAKAADIAARRLGYQDRLFAALNDTDTLAGQLAAFDRTTLRDREAEIKAGGEAIADLEAAQMAERIGIIRDFNQQAIEQQKQALQDAQNFLDGVSRNIRQFVDGLSTGSDSTLSPAARLAAAQSVYNTRRASALGGNRDDLNGITGNASDLLDAARAYYGSGAGYQSVLNTTKAQLTALPSQVSPEQFIVNAVTASGNAIVTATAEMQAALRVAVQANSPTLIAAALSSSFDGIDLSLDGLLNVTELRAALTSSGLAIENGRLASILAELDVNGDGQLSKLELIRAATRDTATTTTSQLAQDVTANNLLTASNNLTVTANVIANYATTIANDQATLLDQIRGLTAVSQQTLDLLLSQYTESKLIDVAGVTVQGNVVESLLKIVYNTGYANQRFIANGNSGPLPFAFAMGGPVVGPGTGTSDSINAKLSNGEFVMREAAARRFGGLLGYMNDNLKLPPIPIVGGGQGSNAMLTELRALRVSNQRLVSEVVRLQGLVNESIDVADQGHRGTASATMKTTAAIDQGNRAAARQALRKTA